MIHIYYLNIHELFENEEWKDKLLQNEVTKYKKTDDQLRSICGRLLLHYAAYESFGLDTFKIQIGENGKPTVQNESFCFNISHCEEMVVCALSSSCVGVDIEKIRKGNYRAIERLLHPFEQEYFEGLNDAMRVQRLFQLYAIKESYLKMTGEGLGIGLNTFFVDTKINAMRNEERKLAWFKEFEIGSYCGAVCSKEMQEVVMHEVSIENVVQMKQG